MRRSAFSVRWIYVFRHASGLVVSRDMEVLLACPHLQSLFLFDGRRNGESDPHLSLEVRLFVAVQSYDRHLYIYSTLQNVTGCRVSVCRTSNNEITRWQRYEHNFKRKNKPRCLSISRFKISNTSWNDIH